MNIIAALRNIAVNLFRMEQRKLEKFRKSSPRRKWLTYSNFILPIVFFYYEVVFRLSTTGGLFRWSLILTLLFSVCWGMLGWFLTTLTKTPKYNRWIKLGIMILVAIPFLVEYFVFRKFKTLYDLNTVRGGAGDVAGGFMGDAAKMIFSPSGLLRILLFFLPAILYGVFGGHFDPARGANARRRIKTAVMLLLTFWLTLILCFIPPTYRSSYSRQYNFENAVHNFGFMTGMRLEIKRSIFGTRSSFESEDGESGSAAAGSADTPVANIIAAIPDPDAAAARETAPEPSPVEYGLSVMDIDFDSLPDDGSVYAEINDYVKRQTPSHKNEYTGLFQGKNLIFLSAEAFSAEAIDPERTPTLYRLATKGINFTDYYQPEIAGTTGGEYYNIFGMVPSNGGTSMEDVVENYNPFIMSEQLNNLGYYGKAFHNNDYTYYSRDYTHNRLGFSDGYMGYGNGMEEFITPAWPESDLEMLEGTVPMYIDKQPFNIYYMTVSGHSDYWRGENWQAEKNWETVADLDYSDPVKGYLAANVELEKAMAFLVSELEKAGIADDTVIVLGADHFPYGLDDDGPLGELPYLSELYGYNVTDYLQRDHNRLIIWSGCLEDMDPIIVDEPSSSIDILPTLLNLFGLEWDSRLLPGRDVLSDAEPLVFESYYDWKTDKGTYIQRTDTFTQTDPNETLPKDYVSRMQTIVRNKLNYCDSVLDYDYFGYLFGNQD